MYFCHYACLSVTMSVIMFLLTKCLPLHVSQRSHAPIPEDGSQNPAPGLSLRVKSRYFPHKSRDELTSRTRCSLVKSRLPVSDRCNPRGAPEFHRMFTRIHRMFTRIHRISSEFCQSIESEHLTQGDSHNSAFPHARPSFSRGRALRARQARTPATGIARQTPRRVTSRGNYGGPKEWGSQVTTGLIAFEFYSQFFTCSSPHVDRCSNPRPWDPLGTP